jgi:FkbM family methyltransferase
MITQVIALLPPKILAILRFIKNRYMLDYSSKTFSQEGEDIILRRIFQSKEDGFYVDVGAHHPFKYSNTYIFYKKGWTGINLDAMPGSMMLFEKYRPRDINLEIPIGNSEGNLTYNIFNDKALNGFSKEISNKREIDDEYYIEAKIEMKVTKLSKILDEYLPKNKEIDFLTIDVEGLDFEVLESNDWQKFKPKCILIEILGSSLHDIYNNKITHFLISHGYDVFAKAVNSVIFMRR